MTESRFSREGQEAYKALFGTKRKYDDDKDTELDVMTVNHVFANVWSRTEKLPTKLRSMLTVALLAALGRDNELRRHVQGAINLGVGQKTINEIMIHVAHYAGWPAGHNGQRIAGGVYKQLVPCLEKSKVPAHRRIVFCDFDGTITNRETFEGMFLELIPDQALDVLSDIHCEKTTIREGVIKLLSEIPIEDYHNRIIETVKNEKPRTGFHEFLKFLQKDHKARFVLISGGLRIMLQAVIGKVITEDIDVHAVNIKVVDGRLKPSVNDSQSDELMIKLDKIDRYEKNYDELIYIGDGLTDVKAARRFVEKAKLTKHTRENKKSYIVFARDTLAEKLPKGSFVPWRNFEEIQNCLKKRWRE